MAEFGRRDCLKSNCPKGRLGSSPSLAIERSVAQLAERRFPKPNVEGSSPSRPVKCRYSKLGWEEKEDCSVTQDRSTQAAR